MPTLHHILTEKVDGRLADCATATDDPNIFAINRDKFVPVLFIRSAKVEDNDDIRNEFNVQTLRSV